MSFLFTSQKQRLTLAFLFTLFIFQTSKQRKTKSKISFKKKFKKVGGFTQLYASGDNSYGQLGFGDTTNINAFNQVPMNNIIQIASGVSSGWGFTLFLFRNCFFYLFF